MRLQGSIWLTVSVCGGIVLSSEANSGGGSNNYVPYNSYEQQPQTTGRFEEQSQHQLQQNSWENDLLQRRLEREKEDLPPLPPGWSEHFDPSSGQPYYYNQVDGTTTWDRPIVEVENKEGNVELDPQYNETNSDGKEMYHQDSTRSTTDSNPVDDTLVGPSFKAESYSERQSKVFQDPRASESIRGEEEVMDLPKTTSTDESWKSSAERWGQPGEASSLEEPEQLQQQLLSPPPDEKYLKESPSRPGWGLNSFVESRPEADLKPSLSDNQPPPYRFPQQPDPRMIQQPPPSHFDPQQNIAVTHHQQHGGPNQQESNIAHPPEAHSDLPPIARIPPQQIPPGFSGSSIPPQSQNLPYYGQPTIGDNPKIPAWKRQENGLRQPAESRLFDTNGKYSNEPEKHEYQQQHGQYQRSSIPPQETGSLRQPDRPIQQNIGGYPFDQRQPPRPEPGQYMGGGQFHHPNAQGYFNGGPPQGYGQQQPSGQLVPQEKPDPVRETIGKTWQGIMGLSNRTREALETTRQTVEKNAREATQTLHTQGSGWWGQTMSKIGSIFESSSGPNEDYSLSGMHGSNAGPQSFPSGPSVQQQQPPPGYPLRPTGSYPTPQRGYPPQQQQLPPGRYPPGYNPPQPRSDMPYPPQWQEGQRQEGQKQDRPPMQTQWGQGGSVAGSGYLPQQNYPYDPRQQVPHPNERSVRPPSSGQLGVNQNNNDPSDKQKLDPWQHPSLGPEGY